MKIRSLFKILEDILPDIFDREEVIQQAYKILGGVLNSHTAGIASTHLARSFTKRLDGVIDAEKSALTLPQRTAVAQALADNACLQLHEFEALLKEYPFFQAEVVKAKGSGDTLRLQAVRAQRLAAQNQIRRALDEVSDALAGKLGG